MSEIEIMEALKKPFPKESISWRAGATNAKKNGGKPNKCIALAYIDARDVMNRLDEVFGLNWHCQYSHADKKTICEISVLIGDKLVTRSNGAGDSDIEAEKGAISDAFKRAAVMFGIGRYLYDLPNVWVECDEWGHIKNPPALPAWALPNDTKDKNNVHTILDKPANEPPTPERLEHLKEKAAEIVDFHSKGLLDDMFVVYDNIADMGEREALWTILKPNSAVRTAIKNIGEQKRKAA